MPKGKGYIGGEYQEVRIVGSHVRSIWSPQDMVTMCDLLKAAL